jgi:hypothetical protein
VAAQVYRHGDRFYLTGAGATSCVGWRRDGEAWVSAPDTLPAQAQRVGVRDLPVELREELLAFATRAEVMGAAARQLGN